MSELSNGNNGNKLRIIGVATGATAVALGAGALISSGADCNPDLGDVCVPGVTAPPDRDPVPGNPKPGETIPVSPTMPPKGGESTSTTEPEETTTTSSTTTTTSTTSTTVPGSTTTTSTSVPESTTTTEAPTTTVVVTSAPPTMPEITVTVPTVPQETN